MPIWAYIYCGLFIFSCCFSLFDKDRLRRQYQPAGEILDCLCGILIFLIGFTVIELHQAPLISSLCFMFNIAWSYHAHRHYLNFEKISSDIHKSAIEEHEKLVEKLTKINEAAIAEGASPEELEEIDDEYDRTTTEKEARYFYNGILIVLVIVLLPYFYVFLKSIGILGN